VPGPHLLNIEVILPIDIDVGIACGPDMREVLLLYGIAFTSKLLHDRRYVDRIPANHGIGDQVET
jgi:hypothetical protein